MTPAQLSEPGAELLRRLAGFLPNLLAAFGLALLGWLAARLLRYLSVRLLHAWGRRLAGGIGRFVPGRNVADKVQHAAQNRSIAEALGSVVFWLVLLFFLAAATEALGLPVVSTWLSGVAAYLPRILAAVLILVLGFVAGGLARTAMAAAASSAGFAYSDLMGRLAQGLIVLVSAVVGFDQLGVHTTFLTVLAAVVAGACLGGAALAFGLGARTAVSNIIACHYLLKIYRVGHRVRIGDLEGRIVDITPTAVVIETPDGQGVVPAKEFSERASLLLTS